MTKKRIKLRKFLYNSTVFMLIWGLFVTGIRIEIEYTMNRDRKLIQKAKAIQPFPQLDETIQSGLRSFFGNSGEWTVEGKQIHVLVERGFSSALPDTMEFDIPRSFEQCYPTEDGELWIFEHVFVDGKEQTQEEAYWLMRTIMTSASRVKMRK